MDDGSVADCPFCLPAIRPAIVMSDEHSYAMWTGEDPAGSAMVLPLAHRATVFDLTDDEWTSTQRLLLKMRALIIAAHNPDGFNVGWNVAEVAGQSVAHAHCHLIPRYRDEPYAGRGIRAWFKSPANRRTGHPERRPESNEETDLPATTG